MSDCDPLRYLCKRYGPVEITYVAENNPHCWTAQLVSTHDGTSTWNHAHGERLESTLQELLTSIERTGVVFMADALTQGGVRP